ncbi:MAG: tetratricopeptide repeat protein, partial [Gemmatimonadota bacterium]
AEDLAGEEAAGEEVAGEEVAGEEVAGEEVVEVEGVDEVDEVEEEEEVEEPGVDDVEEEAAEPLPLLDTGHDLGEEGFEDEEEPEPLPLLEGAYTDDESGQEGPEEAGTEAPEEVPEEPPAAELPLDELQPLPPMDLTSAGELEEPSDDVPEHIEGAMDLDLGAMSLGLEADEAEVEDLDVDAVIQRGRELVSRGLWGEALRELRLLSGLDAEPEVFKAALQIVNEVVRNDANNVEALQRRVEYAARTGDHAVLVNAYMDLADALARLGSETKARVMYERVLDMDPANEAAREALGVEGGVEPTIDLDAVLREMGPDELEEVAARKASDPDFAAMLSQFKAKVTERVEVDDGDHYDLGLAFKEMGLIDEAIGEFQAALKGGTERLKVYEELGQCFMQKSQYNVALKVFKRALQVPYADESELLGVYYHMGQCHEELGQRAEAREAYRKVLAIDETFRDVPDRVARL